MTGVTISAASAVGDDSALFRCCGIVSAADGGGALHAEDWLASGRASYGVKWSHHSVTFHWSTREAGTRTQRRMPESGHKKIYRGNCGQRGKKRKQFFLPSAR